MQTIERLDMLRTQVGAWRDAGARIALVPTMGALHEGHMALVSAARSQAKRVVVSIFVNPTQFGPGEDFDAYPRERERDADMLAKAGVDLLWRPAVETIYPAGFATTVSVGDLTGDYCGAARPGHFDAVATVVCKLFHQVAPDIALFGEKDYQQLAVIRRMARDLDLTHPAADCIAGVATVREEDGLARSSRNRYLSPGHRARAAALPAAMRDAVAAIERGEPIARVLSGLGETLLASGFERVDYAALADADTLERLEKADRPARLLVAARIDGTRLIDNMPVKAAR